MQGVRGKNEYIFPCHYSKTEWDVSWQLKHGKYFHSPQNLSCRALDTHLNRTNFTGKQEIARPEDCEAALDNDFIL